MPRKRQGRPRWFLLLALTGIAVLANGCGGNPTESERLQTGAATERFRGNVLPDGLRDRKAPRLRLRDARGGKLDTSRLRGTPYVVTFLYTHCPDVCPLIGQELRGALERLGGRAGDVAVVAVSVDPAGDTREAVTAWLRRHRLPPNFHYLIGSERELRPAWKSYFVGPQQQGVKQSLHTASIWLIDASGRLRTKFSGGLPVPPRDIAHDLRVLLDEETPG